MCAGTQMSVFRQNGELYGKYIKNSGSYSKMHMPCYMCRPGYCGAKEYKL